MTRRRGRRLFLTPRDGAGCSTKTASSTVAEIMKTAKLASPEGSIGTVDMEDAAIERAPDGSWSLLTCDNSILTGDTAFNCGAIAALNAMSDVWAKGGTPTRLAATLIVADSLDQHDICEIVRGAGAAAEAAGAFYVTGQTNRNIDGRSSWLGFAVTGTVAAGRQPMLKRGLRPGQVLVLTKPIGTGLVMMASEDGLLDEETLGATLETMLVSNQQASEVFMSFGVSACTDVSGSGLAGSIAEMVSASCKKALIRFSAIPLLPGTRDMAGHVGIRPTSNDANEIWSEDKAEWSFPENARRIRAILFDPQTSGGLLAGVEPDAADDVVTQLAAAVIGGAIIGGVEESDRPSVVVEE
jgi:selenide,water dikinase